MKSIALGCIIVFSIGAIMLLYAATQDKPQEPITFQRFEQMLKQKDVDKVVTYKSEDLLVAEVFLKTGSLDKPEYRVDAVHNHVFNGGHTDTVRLSWIQGRKKKNYWRYRRITVGDFSWTYRVNSRLRYGKNPIKNGWRHPGLTTILLPA